MKVKNTLALFALVLTGTLSNSFAQNYVDKYLTDALTYTTIGTSSTGLNKPRDLDFKPGTNELWVVNNTLAGSAVIFYNAGQSNQTAQFRQDSHTGHFMGYSSALSFSDIGEIGTTGEIVQTDGAGSTFEGPALWLSDTNIYARVFQNNWVSGLPLGSHIDMLHQSPYAMGIAHDNGRAYWVNDGYNGNICKYDFVSDHGPGYDDHSAGVIYRYTGVTVSRVAGIPSHMVVDKANSWLYFIDGGSNTLKRLNVKSGTIAGNLQTPSTAQEPLAGYYDMHNATVQTVDTYSSAIQACGVDYYNNRLVVSDYNSGVIIIYNTSGSTPVKMGTVQTNQAGMMGIKIGSDGKIWFVNNSSNKVIRIDPAPVTDDACVADIISPLVEDYQLGIYSFFSVKFDHCSNSLAPVVSLKNMGSNTLTSCTINYMVDKGTVNTFSWTGTLAAGASANVTLPASSVSDGTHQLTAYTSSPNGVSDSNPMNDMKTGAFRALATQMSLPFTEGFSSTTFPPTGWSYVNFDKIIKMKQVPTVGGFGTNTGCVKFDNYPASIDISGQRDYLMFPRLDFSNASSSAKLKFSVAFTQQSSSTNDALYVYGSTDCGATWKNLYFKSGATLATTPSVTTAFTPTASQWRTETVDLSTLAGRSDVLLTFATESNFGNNIYIDDVNINDPLLSVANQIEPSSFNLYPNPSTGEVFIESNFVTDNQTTISVFNLIGEKILESKMEKNADNKYLIHLSGQPNGTYLIRMSGKEQSAVRKVTLVN